MPYLMNGTVENLSSNTKLNLGDTLPVDGLKARATEPEWNSEWTRLIPVREIFYYLGKPPMVSFSLASRTYIWQPHV